MTRATLSQKRIDRITAAAVISATVHVAGLMLWQHTAPPSPPAIPLPLNVTLNTAEPISIPSQPKQQQKPSRSEHPRPHRSLPTKTAPPPPKNNGASPVDRSTTHTSQAAAPTPTETSNDSSASTPSSTPQSNSVSEAPVQKPSPAIATRAFLVTEVHKRIDRQYPPLARKYGWQGDVRLSFRINNNGVINDIHILQGSGHPILDSSAIKSLSQVKLIETHLQIPHEFEADLVISYRLQDS